MPFVAALTHLSMLTEPDSSDITIHCDPFMSFGVFAVWKKLYSINQSGAAANFGDRTYRQIWGPNVNNNIYILTHEYSSTGFE